MLSAWQLWTPVHIDNSEPVVLGVGLQVKSCSTALSLATYSLCDLAVCANL